MQSAEEDDDYEREEALPPEPEPVDTTSISRIWIGLLLTTVAFLPVYSPLRLFYGPVFRWLHIRTFYENVVFFALYQ